MSSPQPVLTPSPAPSATPRRPIGPVVPSSGALRPLGLADVAITGGFWGDRQAVNRSATLPHIAGWLERAGWIGNYDLAAAGTLPQGRHGREFADSEIYKFLEAAAWDLGQHPDPELEAVFRDVVRRVGAAQEPDGYLHTNFGRPGQAPRWSDLAWGHELYCFGHLFQAAVARHRTRPDADDGLVEIARRVADLVCDTFGDGGIESVCGHAEVEPALVELGRELGEPRYIEMARVFVERRGHQSLPDIEFGRAYFQDDVPVRDASVMRGHAVRANYLNAGAVDVAVETADQDLLAVLRGQAAETVARRTYVTGGQGSHHQDEAFGDDFELPVDRAYSETCAGIGSVMFNERLLLATGDERYADVIERTLYNVVATGVAREGTSFFYTNTLHQRTTTTDVAQDELNPRASSALRAPWFEVSCCPPNIARTIASLAALVATTDDSGIQVHQFVPATIHAALPTGAVDLVVSTAYPDDGVVSVRVAASESSEPWTLAVRVPGWAVGATATLRPAAGGAESLVAEPGLLRVERAFDPGDVVELVLPMEPRVSQPDPRIDAVRGCVVVERGPLVLCLESVDLPSGDVNTVELAPGTQPELVDGRVLVQLRRRSVAEESWPYTVAGGDHPTFEDLGRVPLVPYQDWGNRGPGTMRVWLPVGS